MAISLITFATASSQDQSERALRLRLAAAEGFFFFFSEGSSSFICDGANKLHSTGFFSFMLYARRPNRRRFISSSASNHIPNSSERRISQTDRFNSRKIQAVSLNLHHQIHTKLPLLKVSSSQGE